MDKKPPANADELARKLQERLRHERPRWVRWVPLLAMTLFGVLAVMGWVMYPAPVPPPLTVTAADALIVRGEPVLVQAFLDPLEPDAKAASLAKQEAAFGIAPSGQVVESSPRLTSLSDARGRLTATLELGEAAKATYFVRQIPLDKRQEPSRDVACVYMAAPETPLVLVDAEETLADLDPGLWTKTNPLEINPRAGAAAALRAVQAKRNALIVYFAAGLTPAREYRRARSWVGLKVLDKDGLPDGPVLGRLRYDERDDAATARHALLKDLRRRCPGDIVAVVRGADAAEQCLALGFRTIAMGGGDFPKGVLTMKSWRDFPTLVLP